MEQILDSKEIKSLVDEKNMNNLKEIYKIFKDKEIIQLTLKAQKEYTEKAENILEYMKYFVNNLIENISIILSNECNKKNKLQENICLEIVVSYLLKIIKSRFNFFPSHKLSLLIYYYLSNSKVNLSTLQNQINSYYTVLNNDLCACYLYFCSINTEEYEFDITKSNEFHKNLENLFDLQLNIPTIPYLEFFNNFMNISLKDKYYYILVINYLKKVINKDDNSKIANLYSLINYLKINNNNTKDLSTKIINNYYNIKNNRVNELTNISVKNILQYSLKSLKINDISDIKVIANEIDNSNKDKSFRNRPIITEKFDKINEYYKDLENELYYIIINKTNYFEINSHFQQRNYWCCIIQLLNLLLDDDNIKNPTIKILFYNIVKLFDKIMDFRIEKDFISNIINLLFILFKSKLDHFLYPEISYLLNNNEIIYEIFLKNENEKILLSEIEKLVIPYFPDEFIKNYDINNMKKFELKNEFFSIFYDFFNEKKITQLDGLDIIKFYQSYNLARTNNNLKYLFYTLYIYFNTFLNTKEYKKIDIEIKHISDSEINIIEKYMKELLQDNNFLILIKEIIKSKVMREAYSIIKKEDQKEKIKLIMKKYDILSFYEDFCLKLDKYLKNETFILMPISKKYKAYTFRFLRIVINTENVEFQNENPMNKNERKTLLKAYLAFLLIHELNHFIKRLNMINIDSEEAVTPRSNEGGKELMNLLFGHYLLNNNINLNQANYILDINNWKKNLDDFKNGYNNTLKEKNDKSIAFLYTGYSEICYNGFLK